MANKKLYIHTAEVACGVSACCASTFPSSNHSSSTPGGVFSGPSLMLLEGIRFNVQHLPHRPGSEARAIRQHRHVDGQLRIRTVISLLRIYIIHIDISIPTVLIVRVRMPSVGVLFVLIARVRMPSVLTSWDTLNTLQSVSSNSQEIVSSFCRRPLETFDFQSRWFLSNIGVFSFASVSLCGNELLLWV